MHGGGDRFPPTRHSAVRALREGDSGARARALDLLTAAYWKPIYKYVRLKWKAPDAEAEDLTQGFFARALEKDFFDRYEPGRAAFRTWLRLGIDGFVLNERKAERREKRGGGQVHVPLDFETAEGELRQHEIGGGITPEQYFDQEWVRSVFGLAVESLKRSLASTGKEVHFALFERYDLDPAEPRPSYQELANQHALPVTQVTNFLSVARREFRRLLLDHLREITATDEEFRDEARSLLGIDP